MKEPGNSSAVGSHSSVRCSHEMEEGVLSTRNVLKLLGAQGSSGKGMEGSDPPLLRRGDNLGREGRLDHGPAASKMSPTEVNGVSRKSSIQPDQGTLPCPNKGHFLWDAIFILNFRERFFFPCLPHLSMALGTGIFPAAQRERSLFLASGFTDGCREASKCPWQINCVSRERGFFPSFFSS